MPNPIELTGRQITGLLGTEARKHTLLVRASLPLALRIQH